MVTRQVRKLLELSRTIILPLGCKCHSVTDSWNASHEVCTDSNTLLYYSQLPA